jgi:hypothetical protein
MSIGFAPPSSPPERPPRELLFQFHADHRFYRAELINRGKWGIEAQIVETADDLRIGQRFDDRAHAVRWAVAMRADRGEARRSLG